MTICREWMLQRQSPERAEAKPLLCRSWGCEHCQPLRRRQLMAQAASGEPNRFLTLTVNPAYLDSPESRLKALAWAWRTVVKRLRREHRGESIEYLAVVEATKAGEPHLHILLRSPFIPHFQLSKYMGELINAPIVDIRKIANRSQVVAYVAKYITKKPEQFGTSKRYWSSRHYEISDEWEPDDPSMSDAPWTVFQYHGRLLMAMWEASGYSPITVKDDRMSADWHPPGGLSP